MNRPFTLGQSVSMSLLVAGIAASTLHAQNARPQSPAAPKTEQDCQKQLEDTKKKLDEANHRIVELMKQNEELRKAAGSSGGGKSADKPAAATPGSPLSSPQAMYDALVKDYQVKFGAMPRDSRSEQARLIDAVRAWAREQSRSMRGPVEWTCQIIDTRSVPGARAVEVTLQVIDARNGKDIGVPVTVPIQTRIAKDLTKGKRFVIKATASAKPEVNPQRAEKGADDQPMFIGAYTEFDFDLEVAQATPAPETTP